MKKALLTLSTVITATAAVTSLYLSTLSNPTDIQKQLNNTTNTVILAGSTAIFGLLGEKDKDTKNSP
jgi:cytosine/uracil/thiamine/allantoin permease